MIPHSEMLLVAALRTQHPSPERNAKIFWFAFKRANAMIREGRFNLVDMFIDEMNSVVADGRTGPLRRHLRRAANDLAFRCTAARIALAEDLERAV